MVLILIVIYKAITGDHGYDGSGEEVGLGEWAKPPKLPYPCENNDF